MDCWWFFLLHCWKCWKWKCWVNIIGIDSAQLVTRPCPVQAPAGHGTVALRDPGTKLERRRKAMEPVPGSPVGLLAYCGDISTTSLSGWWLTYTSEKYIKNMTVNWDDDIPNMWINKKCCKSPTSYLVWLASLAINQLTRRAPLSHRCSRGFHHPMLHVSCTLGFSDHVLKLRSSYLDVVNL